MTPTQFKTIREDAGLSLAETACILDVSDLRTVRRYEAGDRSISGPIGTLMTMLANGELPQWVLDRKAP